MAGNIRSYSYEEYVERVRAFHHFAAPGVIIGGFMVDLAYRHLPGEGPHDALCETSRCLPDAIQLLTPCTAGNGRLTVINLGRYALSIYNRSTGKGVRVFIDPARLDERPEIRSWFFKSKPKQEQDELLLLDEIAEAAGSVCGVRAVEVARRFMESRHRGEFAVCPGCRESYPASDGALCLGCQGTDPYVRNPA